MSNNEKIAKSGLNGHYGQNGQNGQGFQKHLLHLCLITATEMKERSGCVYRSDFSLPYKGSSAVAFKQAGSGY